MNKVCVVNFKILIVNLRTWFSDMFSSYFLSINICILTIMIMHVFHISPGARTVTLMLELRYLC